MVLRRLLSIALAVAILLTATTANPIQIIEHTTTVKGQVVSHTLTVGITHAQLLLGPIRGFFVNLALSPLIGPSPEINSIEIDLGSKSFEDCGITPAGDSAWCVLPGTDTVSAPTTVIIHVDIEFAATTPAGATATYNLSSIDPNWNAIETLQFESTAPAGTIPTLSEWGLIILATLVLATLVWVAVNRRRRIATA